MLRIRVILTPPAPIIKRVGDIFPVFLQRHRGVLDRHRGCDRSKRKVCIPGRRSGRDIAAVLERQYQIIGVEFPVTVPIARGLRRVAGNGV